MHLQKFQLLIKHVHGRIETFSKSAEQLSPMDLHTLLDSLLEVDRTYAKKLKRQIVQEEAFFDRYILCRANRNTQVTFLDIIKYKHS